MKLCHREDNPSLDASYAVLSCAAEEPHRPFERVALLAAAITVMLAFVNWQLPNQAFLVTLALAVGIASTLGSRLFRRQMLIVRAHDFILLDCKSYQRTAWDAISSIKSVGLGMELQMKDGERRTIELDFLQSHQYFTTVSSVIRFHEAFTVLGPLKYPAATAGFSLSTANLNLRLVDISDRDQFVSLKSSSVLAAFQLNPVISRELALDAFDQRLESMHSNCGTWEFAIEKDGQRVGQTAIALTDYILRHATMGIELQPSFWNQGIGTEALSALIEFARQYTNFTKIEAACFSENMACNKALVKAGMLPTGTTEEFWIKNGSWIAGNHFALSLAPDDLTKSVE
ncbi:MAG: GNAT family N-acetyltransferase [Verrucomicrobiae bacterium]|nr:GNAT family N-acetyltransferase [Verrucomicrobiae bacterium]